MYDRIVRIRPKADWTADGPPSFKVQLHSLFFLDPLLQLYTAFDDRDAFELAVACATDWIKSNPIETSSGPYPWNDKATADRVGYLAYLLRLGAHRRALSDESITVLLGSIRQHGNVLADQDHYSGHSNHGLFQDQGLLHLAKYLGGILDEANQWRALACDRLKENIYKHVAVTDGIWLEHSTAYQTVVVNLLRRLHARSLLDDDDLKQLTRRMEDATGWLVAADGNLAQIGDTNLMAPPSWVSSTPKRGMKIFRDTGWAVVRQPGSSLFVTACYHSKAHKHHDELSFELCERNRRVVIDPGLYAYDYADPLRHYAINAQGHNGLTIGDCMQDVRKCPPYGSGITSASANQGGFEIKAINPLLKHQQISHSRRFLYHPGSHLKIYDDINAPSEQTYRRHFHLAPDLQARTVDGALELSAHGFCARLEDADGISPRLIEGWTFPSNGEAIGSLTAVFDCTTVNAKLETVLRVENRGH